MEIIMAMSDISLNGPLAINCNNRQESNKYKQLLPNCCRCECKLS